MASRYEEEMKKRGDAQYLGLSSSSRLASLLGRRRCPRRAAARPRRRRRGGRRRLGHGLPLPGHGHDGAQRQVQAGTSPNYWPTSCRRLAQQRPAEETDRTAQIVRRAAWMAPCLVISTRPGRGNEAIKGGGRARHARVWARLCSACSSLSSSRSAGWSRGACRA